MTAGRLRTRRSWRDGLPPVRSRADRQEPVPPSYTNAPISPGSGDSMRKGLPVVG
jgi:hypothetical protein